jgi:hypothetical protein
MNGADSLFWDEDPMPVPERKITMIYMGVDPGVSGGIAVVDEHGSCLGALKMPETDRDLWDYIDEIGDRWTHPTAPVKAVLERAGATPQMGVTSAFTFGRGYGLLRMALIAAAIPFDVVTSHVWQKTMGCRSGGDKNVTKQRAQQLFPSVKVTHAIADALLIAEFCRRTERGSLNREPAGVNDGKEEEGRIIESRKAIREGLERGLAAAVTQGRRESATRRPDQKAPAARAVARRGGRPRLEGDR